MAYTADMIKEKLQTNQAWLERAVIAIYEYQTEHEQQVEVTEEYNKVGFSAADANYLSYIATWLNSGKHLSGTHLQKVRGRMIKYSGQLARIANGEQSN